MPLSRFDLDLTSSLDPIRIPDEVWERMQGRSWHPDRGCPGREDLALLTVPYLDFGGHARFGPLIVLATVAEDVAAIFKEIFDTEEFRIERMQLVDDFDGDDNRSMAANNTSAFNCRATTGGTRLSAHGLGIAIDINPIQNPFVKGEQIEPPEGKDFNDEIKREAAFQRGQFGLIMPRDVVTKAFKDRGWKWGGKFTDRKDFQHFSQNGR
jgi:hypothetical protein